MTYQRPHLEAGFAMQAGDRHNEKFGVGIVDMIICRKNRQSMVRTSAIYRTIQLLDISVTASYITFTDRPDRRGRIAESVDLLSV